SGITVTVDGNVPAVPVSVMVAPVEGAGTSSVTVMVTDAPVDNVAVAGERSTSVAGASTSMTGAVPVAGPLVKGAVMIAAPVVSARPCTGMFAVALPAITVTVDGTTSDAGSDDVSDTIVSLVTACDITTWIGFGIAVVPFRRTNAS